MKEIFSESLDQSPAARDAFVREACGADEVLLQGVLELLDSHSRASGTLSHPLFPFLLREQPERLPRFSPSMIVAHRFRIIRLIARGGMGEVYEAEDLQLGVQVALKTIRPDVADDPRVLDQFKNEIQTARRVTHPNVCRIYDLAQHSEPTANRGEEVTIFLTMELLVGETLSEHLVTHGAFGPEEALPIIQQLASALDAAHKAGVIHRDFKPGNVMLVPDATGKLHATVTDFGLAIARAQLRSQTLPRAAGGTPAYMAPEQVRGGEVTPATDVFSLGRVIAEVIGARIQLAVASGVTLTLPETFRRWEHILLRCLETDPTKRYSSPIEVFEALTTASGPRPTLIRTKSLLTVASLFVALLGLAAFVAQRYGQWPIMDPATYRKLGPDEESVTIWRPSPDGRYFAVTDRKTGNLGLRNIASGEIRLLTNRSKSEGPISSAVFSPGGSQIAYTRWLNPGVQMHPSVQELRINDINTGTDSLLYASDPSDPALVYCDVTDWSPDGSRILARFSGQDSRQVAVISVADHSVTYPLPKGNYGNSVFAPDSAHVVFSAPQSERSIEMDIFEVPISGGSIVPLIRDPADDYIIGFSRDGRRLIFSSDRMGTVGIWSLAFYGNTAQGQPMVLGHDLGRASVIGMTQDGTFYYTVATNSRDVYTAEIDLDSGRLISGLNNVVRRFRGRFSTPSWSSDGRQLSFMSVSRRGSRMSSGGVMPEIWVYSRETGGIRALQPNLQILGPIRWDPSGNRILVFGLDRSGRSGIYRVDGSIGATEKAIPSQMLNAGTWAKDGRTLFGMSLSEGIFRIDTQTGQRKVIYAPPEGFDLASQPTLSPDERTLALKVAEKGTSFLMVIPTTGGTARWLRALSQPVTVPFGSFAWTADSTQILAVRTRNQTNELWLVPVSGGNARKIDFPDMPIGELSMSSDGRTIAFTSGEKESGEVWVAENLLPQ